MAAGIQGTAWLWLRGHSNSVALAIIMLLGAFVRLFLLDVVPPNGLLHDEAFAAYESYCLGTWGMDSEGYANPVYLVTWGAGMSALLSYLNIPFVMALGCTTLAARLAVAIVGIIGLFYFYLLTKKVFDTRTALVATALMAISPWDIMTYRFGMDCNIAPTVYVIGLFYLVKGAEAPRFWLLSALFFGLTLYAYAIMWAVVPLTLVLCGIYLVIKRARLPQHKIGWVLSSLALLFVMALPLLLFLLINRGVVPEIITPFISIPKLTVMRASEFSFSNLFTGEAWATALAMFIGLPDEHIWNSVPEFGLFYYLSIPFIILGLIALVVGVVKNFKAPQLDCRLFILLGWLATFITCLMTGDSNVNKSNGMHPYSIIFAAVGILWVIGFVARHAHRLAKVAAGALTVAYVCLFTAFCVFYFTTYSEGDAKYKFFAGLPEAVEWIRDNAPEDAQVVNSLQYPNILYFDEIPAPVFHSTVVYEDDSAQWRNAESYGRYQFVVVPDPLDEGTIYFYANKPGIREYFEGNGFKVRVFDSCLVAYTEQGLK